MSNVIDNGTAPDVETRPNVTRMPHVPLSAAGIRTEQPQSAPIENAHWPEATAQPEPPLDPPTTVSPSHGFFAGGLTTPHENSCVVTFPRQTAPASRSFLIAKASSTGTKSSAIWELHFIGIPATAMTSLTEKHRPCSGPRSSPERSARCAALNLVPRLLGAQCDPGMSHVVDLVDPFERVIKDL